MVMDLPTKGLSTLLRTFVTPQVADPLPETIGLSGLPVLWILGNPLNFGGTQPVGYILSMYLLLDCFSF